MTSPQTGGPAGPAQQPPLSPDGRFWWNGAQWVPVQQPPAYGQPAPGFGQPPAPPKRGLPTAVKVLIGVLTALVVGMVGLFVVGVLVDDGYSSLTCADLAKKAVAISDPDKPIVLKGVSDLSIVEDHRADASTPASGENTILACRGTADWSTIDDSPVVVKMTVDSHGKEWVKYDMAS